jgi:hypothetical protein
MNVIIACYVAGFWEVGRILMLVLSFFGIIMTISYFGDVMFFKDRYKRVYFESIHGFVISLIITIATFLARYAIPHGQELIDFLTAW